MKKVLSGLFIVVLGVLFLGPGVSASTIPPCSIPSQCGDVGEDQVLSWDGSNVKRGSYVLIACYPYATSTLGPTWRSLRLPLTGSIAYKGDNGYKQEIPGEVQCSATVYSRTGKIVGYPTPLQWRWIP